jgi:hypothetical protein
MKSRQRTRTDCLKSDPDDVQFWRPVLTPVASWKALAIAESACRFPMADNGRVQICAHVLRE